MGWPGDVKVIAPCLGFPGWNTKNLRECRRKIEKPVLESQSALQFSLKKGGGARAENVGWKIKESAII